MSDPKDKLPARSSRSEVADFIDKLAVTPVTRAAGERGRLIFAMDATASRGPTWDRAAQIQAEMFTETAALGGLDIQLAFYRGFFEFTATPWLSDADALLKRMTAVSCLAGQTQISRIFQHTIEETQRRRVNALVFVGDCMEEDADQLGQFAGQLGLLGVPVFVFHEGFDPVAAHAFRQIAQLSRGAYCRFDAGSAQQLRDLLSAVAVFAAGGRKALEDYSQRKGGVTLQLTHQIGKQ